MNTIGVWPLWWRNPFGCRWRKLKAPRHGRRQANEQQSYSFLCSYPGLSNFGTVVPRRNQTSIAPLCVSEQSIVYGCIISVVSSIQLENTEHHQAHGIKVIKKYLSTLVSWNFYTPCKPQEATVNLKNYSVLLFRSQNPSQNLFQATSSTYLRHRENSPHAVQIMLLRVPWDHHHTITLWKS